jgi:hypothetical protein
MNHEEPEAYRWSKEWQPEAAHSQDVCTGNEAGARQCRPVEGARDGRRGTRLRVGGYRRRHITGHAATSVTTRDHVFTTSGHVTPATARPTLPWSQM